MLARDTYTFENAYLTQGRKLEYKYDVEFLVIEDLYGKKSIRNTLEFKQYMNKEIAKRKNVIYDMNVVDLYPIEKHYDNRPQIDIDRFNQLNDIILSISPKLCRRVTKKEIVYKKNRIKNVISIIFTKNQGLKIFVNNEMENFDINENFFTISKGNRKPLEKCMKIMTEEDFSYIKKALKNYLDKII
ncbi:MAG: hypothetical protein Q4E75_01000 [bacterium]|nr:hypothetical protein [bacterium]